jgi:molecular chaperone GrpE
LKYTHDLPHIEHKKPLYTKELKMTNNEEDPNLEAENTAQDGDSKVIDFNNSRITQLEEECAKMRDNWVRAVAETDNVRRRSQKDLEESGKYAITGFAKDIVAVLENLQLAVDNIPENTSDPVVKSLREGVNLTLQELLGIFQRHSITRINPLGQKFDHNIHQAVVQVEQNDVEAGTVVQVIQAGYMIADRLLRPAMVAVSKTSNVETKKLDTTA